MRDNNYSRRHRRKRMRARLIMSSLPRYLYFCEKQNIYRYDCPIKLHNLGVVRRRSFSPSDLKKAVEYANEQNALIDAYRSELVVLKDIKSNSKIEEVVKDYFHSVHFTNLAESTKQGYKARLNYWLDKKIDGITLRKARIDTITTAMCQRLYDKLTRDGSIAANNDSLSMFRILFSYAVRRGYINVNPFSLVKPLSTKSRKQVWTKRDVKMFITTAFTQWRWRSLGIIVYCAYEWGQRIGDMRLLTWDCFNFDTGVVTLVQSKRGVKVEIPTSTGLRQVLVQQHKDFGWQKYVAPMVAINRPRQGLVPYSKLYVNKVAREIMDAAGISKELQIRDLRRTAITEMVEMGVPVPSVMSVSGHTSVASLSPYIKHTLKGATNAQQMRQVSEYLLSE